MRMLSYCLLFVTSVSFAEDKSAVELLQSRCVKCHGKEVDGE